MDKGLFEAGEGRGHVPLADRLRPGDFEGLFGQEDLVGEGRLLRRLIEEDKVPSMILWGPPGSGKTTLAHVIAGRTGAKYRFFSAVLSGKADVKRVVTEARHDLRLSGRKTILFVDEIHRFNKLQQDAFLPHVEAGTIVLIGATTENPSFEVNAALLSRCRVFMLSPLSEEALGGILDRAISDCERGLGDLDVSVEADAREALLASSDGDARRLLNVLEAAVAGRGGESVVVTAEDIRQALQRKTLRYDKAGEEHYNLISALHKSMRGSDPQAALYWLARMLQAGEDPLYVARRMVRFASEDVGLADPRALATANAAKDAVHFIGMPEGALALAQAAVYLSTAPKSNCLYEAWARVRRDIEERPAGPVPLAIRNAPTSLMAKLGFGEGYKYPHEYVDGVVAQEYLPEGLVGSRWYRPSEAGFEKEVAKRMAYWTRLREQGRERKKDE